MNLQRRTLPSFRLIWHLFFATVLMALLAKAFTYYHELALLDVIADATVARDLLANMTQAQKHAHLLFTASIDVIYPLVASAYFIAVLMRAFVRYWPYLILPVLVALLLDLAEGVIQVLVLSGTADYLAFKAWTTPIKALCYKLAFLLSLFAVIKILLRQSDRPMAD